MFFPDKGMLIAHRTVVFESAFQGRRQTVAHGFRRTAAISPYPEIGSESLVMPSYLIRKENTKARPVARVTMQPHHQFCPGCVCDAGALFIRHALLLCLLGHHNAIAGTF